MNCMDTTMAVTLTELRQQLFKLADHVADTGEPLLIERRGVRLKLIREDVQATPSRLHRLKAQALVQGAPLRPDESPALWNESPPSRVAEPATGYAGNAGKPRPGNRRS